MAGIGIKLNRIFDRRPVAARLYGFAYSGLVTVAPMFTVMGAVAAGQALLGYAAVGYARRALFSGTLLYMFIFSMIVASPFATAASRRLSDALYSGRSGAALPTFYAGLAAALAAGALLAAPFCLRAWLTRGMPLAWALAGFCGFGALLAAAYAQPFLAIGEKHLPVALFHALGMALAVLLAWMLGRLLRWEPTLALLTGLSAGLALVVSLEIACLHACFPSGGRIREAARAFPPRLRLPIASLLHALGLYVHNFVFWAAAGDGNLPGGFLMLPAYDTATFLALFTNISAPVIFTVRLEMRLHSRMAAYADALAVGRAREIHAAQAALLERARTELLLLARLQCGVTAVGFLLLRSLLPALGFSGPVMQQYPCLCAGWFMVFLAGAALQLLFALEDETGALLTAGLFCLTTAAGALIGARLDGIWRGLGPAAGGFSGFTAAWLSLRRLARRFDAHAFCRGRLIPRGHGKKPAAQVYARPR